MIQFISFVWWTASVNEWSSPLIPDRLIKPVMHPFSEPFVQRPDKAFCNQSPNGGAGGCKTPLCNRRSRPGPACACGIWCDRPVPFSERQKTLHGSIVETLSFSAHGLPDPCSSQDFAVFLTCILTAAIRMIDEPGTGTSPSQSHPEGRAAQIRLHVLVHGPADNFPACHILDGHHMQPAFIRGTIGDVSQPDRVGRVAVKLLLQQVRRGGLFYDCSALSPTELVRTELEKSRCLS